MTTAAAIDSKIDPKRRALGKGLDSLLPRAQAPAAQATESEGGRPREIPLDLIDHNPFQTRSTVNQDQLAELPHPSPPTASSSRCSFVPLRAAAFS